MSRARTNERGPGSDQYPPCMMLGLLIYCYATGTFSSRRIETHTYENVAVRYPMERHHANALILAMFLSYHRRSD